VDTGGFKRRQTEDGATSELGGECCKTVWLSAQRFGCIKLRIACHPPLLIQFLEITVIYFTDKIVIESGLTADLHRVTPLFVVSSDTHRPSAAQRDRFVKLCYRGSHLQDAALQKAGSTKCHLCQCPRVRRQTSDSTLKWY
jgi:hypothetical protein